MYAFMADGNRFRFDEMIDSSHLRALNIDVLLLLDGTSLPVIAYKVDQRGNEQPLSEGLLRELRERAALFAEKASGDAYDDILLTERGVILAGIAPVLTTSRTGPSRGTMLLGVFLENRLPAMQASLGTRFGVFPAVAEDLPDRSSGEVAVIGNGSGEAAIWQRRGEGAVRIEAPREIYEKGKEAVFASFFWIVISGAGILCVVTRLLERFVLDRLRHLRSVFDYVAAKGMIGLRAPVKGSDEIAALSSSFNALLQTVETLVMDIPDALFLTDSEDTVVLTNEAARRTLGCDDDSLKGSHISTVLGTETNDSYSRFDGGRNRAAGDRPVFEAVLLRIDGSLIPVEVHRRRISFGDLPFSLLLARDLTERKRLEERLERKAFFDEMTGLPNRHSFIEELDLCLNERRPAAVAILNMDQFKMVNAQVGHLSADKVLLTVAERMEELLEPPGKLYRTGGDEFSILLPLSSVAKNDIERLMDGIRKAAAAPCDIGGEAVFPSASLGVVSRIPEDMTSAKVIDAALQALAGARKGGLGRIGYYRAPDTPSSADTSINILTVRAELQSALERDEFIPFFQPVYALNTETIKGFETLARWRHPQKGLLQPGAFIPQAERTGLIANLDARIIEHALRSVADAHSDIPSKNIFFTANASSLFLGSLAAVETVEFLLELTGAPPGFFTLEVTESALIENLDDVHKKLDRLKACGIKIALDDFGTGYSSLQYINRLPFDCIKLDRAFVSQLFQSKKTERMMRTIIAMGRDLGLDVIAEGVETAEQLEWLKNAGCGKAQGYWFSRPVPRDEAERMLREVNSG